ncbi:hypothetical protein RB213_013703 [Colletotrichum asianum]
MSAVLMGFAAISSVAAFPMSIAEGSVANQEVPRDAATFDPQNNFEQSEARAMNSKFKIHVVDVINLLPCSHEANFEKLTNVRTSGPVVATHFEDGANPLAAAQNAVFDFATSIASGVAAGIASSTGIHLGGTFLAKTLHAFNENIAKIGSVNLQAQCFGVYHDMVKGAS